MVTSTAISSGQLPGPHINAAANGASLPHLYVPHKPLLGHIRLIENLKEISEVRQEIFDGAFPGSFTARYTSQPTLISFRRPLGR